MSKLKIILPILLCAILAVVLAPILLIWFATDMEQNVTVTGANAGVWTFFTHGLNTIVLLFGEFSYPIAIILIVCAIVIAGLGAIVVFKRIAA